MQQGVKGAPQELPLGVGAEWLRRSGEWGVRLQIKGCGSPVGRMFRVNDEGRRGGAAETGFVNCLGNDDKWG